nr:MAG TPA: hypothetical protein [Caudoviricetes sp.]
MVTETLTFQNKKNSKTTLPRRFGDFTNLNSL